MRIVLEYVGRKVFMEVPQYSVCGTCNMRLGCGSSCLRLACLNVSCERGTVLIDWSIGHVVYDR